MAKTAKKENYDVRAVSVVRRLASREAKDGVCDGLVSNADIAWLYKHAAQLSKEVVHEVLKREAPPISISVEKISKKQLGHYKHGRDGLGLKWRVALNIVWFARPRGDILQTLLHEILHAVQLEDPAKKTKAHHDKTFRAWAELVGIPCDGKGISTGVVPEGPFARYLKRHNIEGAAGLLTKKEAPKAKGSPLKRWTCGCGTNVRVCTFLDATCNLCNSKFELQEPV